MDAHLGKNRSGFWEVRWSERYEDGSWRTRSVSTRTKNRADALAFKAAWLEGLNADAAEAEVARSKTPTVGELIDRYSTDHVDANRRTASQTQSLVFPKRLLGARVHTELDLRVLGDYRASRNRADGTLRRELGALVAVLNWAGKKRLIDPATIPHIDLPPEGQGRSSFLTEEQEAVFYAEAMGHSIGEKRLTRVTRFVALALDTAGRKEALETLTWDRVDLAGGLIDLRDPTRRATKKRRAVVPISARLAPLLERAKREAINEYVLDGGSIVKTWRTWVAQSSFPAITPHDLRRTWATLAARAGVPLWDVAAVLGDTIEVVMKHYAVHQPGHLRGAIDARWSK